jgi:hypothetical protein
MSISNIQSGTSQIFHLCHWVKTHLQLIIKKRKTIHELVTEVTGQLHSELRSIFNIFIFIVTVNELCCIH